MRSRGLRRFFVNARPSDLVRYAHRHTLVGHAGWVSDCAITSNGASAITTSGDDLAVVWDLAEGSCTNVLEGHSGEVLSVVLTRRGRFAVTGSMDATARVWDLAAGSAHLQRAHAGRVHGIVSTPNMASVISYGAFLTLSTPFKANCIDSDFSI